MQSLVRGFRTAVSRTASLARPKVNSVGSLRSVWVTGTQEYANTLNPQIEERDKEAWETFKPFAIRPRRFTDFQMQERYLQTKNFADKGAWFLLAKQRGSLTDEDLLTFAADEYKQTEDGRLLVPRAYIQKLVTAKDAAAAGAVLEEIHNAAPAWFKKSQKDSEEAFRAFWTKPAESKEAEEALRLKIKKDPEFLKLMRQAYDVPEGEEAPWDDWDVDSYIGDFHEPIVVAGADSLEWVTDSPPEFHLFEEQPLVKETGPSNLQQHFFLSEEEKAALKPGH